MEKSVWNVGTWTRRPLAAMASSSPAARRATFARAFVSLIVQVLENFQAGGSCQGLPTRCLPGKRAKRRALP